MPLWPVTNCPSERSESFDGGSTFSERLPSNGSFMRVELPPASPLGAVCSSSPVCDKNVVVSWTDAASSTMLLSAVFWNKGQFQFARMVAPPGILDAFIQRNDNMIGALELLAFVLVLETWKEDIKFARWEAYVDNNGVFYSLINACCKAPDMNLIVGKCWRSLHSTATELTAFRIESKSNIADAGSRAADDYDLRYLGSQEVQAKLPSFLDHIWDAPIHGE